MNLHNDLMGPILQRLKEIKLSGTSLAVQWLRPLLMQRVRVQGSKIQHAVQCGQKILENEEKKLNSFGHTHSISKGKIQASL